jgi:hypothetical protein
MKTQKSTIKYQALQRIAQEPIKRKDIIAFIKELNGTTSTSTSYYGDAFVAWENEKLITKENGVFSISTLGKLYLNDPKLYKEVKSFFSKERKSLINNVNVFIYDLLTSYKKSIDLLGYDIDRMSESGVETYVKLYDMVDKHQAYFDSISE